MGNVLVNETTLASIADAIRYKNGSTEKYKPIEMCDAVIDLNTGDSSVFVDGIIEGSYSGAIKSIKATKVRDWAFYEMRNITSVDLPNATEVGECAFSSCSGLKTLNLPKVTKIGDYGIMSCTTLEELNIPEVVEIGECGVHVSPITSLYVPKLEVIGRSGMACLYKLTELNLPSLKQINGDDAFGDCEELTEISFPKIESITGTQIFLGCFKLETLTFESTPTSIDANAFTGSRLRRIFVPWSEGEVAGAPWGATEATIFYNS